LGWDPNTEADLAGYNIYYGTATRGYGSPIDVGNQTEYTVNGLEEGQTYYFAAAAYDTNGNESDYSNEVSETIPVQEPTPDEPGIEPPKNLVWSPVLDEDIVGYKVYYGTASRTYGAPVDVGNQTSYSLAGFETGQIYYFAVKAYNTAGVESEFSEELAWTNSGSTPPANQPPIISGTPSTSVAEGVAYSFTPTASDADTGDTLTFSIINKPSWASFNSSSGRLRGTPGNGDIGTTTGIRITVTDSSNANASLPSFNLTVTNYVQPGDVNDSGTIDLVDLFLVQKLIAGITPGATVYTAADVNGDGKIGLAEMEYIKINITPHSFSSPQAERTEAESGNLTAPMQIESNSESSGSGYIRTTTSNSGIATYTLNVDTPGTYKIIARVYVIGEYSNSFFVQIDDNEESIWDINPEGDPNNYNVWFEDEVTKRGTGTFDNPQHDPYTIELTSGMHTVTFRGRETNSMLDYFYLSPN
jgi:fibronectin type 3 domain-containing protein